ncbi:hypothetical protein O1611_g2656 [Lasiodiplodia mahajangana]|uniref:Uncharacterized protein n=1 Tax=Lasiodiplodia mahajangana TaxID=1108764 RepID=A0ACC2JTX3_9PEZI|nr:hypothetical protein O1611_g2656 [Lasiodiplodia mahajangana]
MASKPSSPFDNPWALPLDRTRTQVNNMCWRVQNVPYDWTKETLRAHLEPLSDRGCLEVSWITLHPAVSSATQTALLCFKVVPSFFQDLNPNEAHPLKIGEYTEGDLSIDCHFRGLTPLNTPTGDSIIDIIAVTGLGGHAFGSWRNRKSYRMWFMDFLPVDLAENVRVMTYGYDSDLQTPGRKTLLEFSRKFLQSLMNARASGDEGSRPIVFIGHSLGCVLIARALVKSRSDPNYQSIFPSTRAMFFFGAPHAGLDVDALVGMVDNVTLGDRKSTRAKLLDHLRENSEYLEEHKENVVQLWSKPKLQVVSFYELRKTRIVAKDHSGEWARNGTEVQLVQNMSSLLFIPLEVRYSVDEDHSEMVKFMNPTDETYRTVIRHTRGLLAQYAAEHLSL